MILTNFVDSIESPKLTGNPIPEAVLNARAIGAYIYGNSWPTYWEYSQARPDLDKIGWIVTIGLRPSGGTRKFRCFDIEDGGGKVQEINQFMQEDADRTWGLPWLYTFASLGQSVIDEADRHGFKQGRDYYYWSAHPGQHGEFSHICSPSACGYPEADGTQNNFNVAGNCDSSWLNSYMLPSLTPPKPATEDNMALAAVVKNNKIEVFCELPTGEVMHTYQTDESGSWKGQQGVTSHLWESLGLPSKFGTVKAS